MSGYSQCWRKLNHSWSYTQSRKMSVQKKPAEVPWPLSWQRWHSGWPSNNQLGKFSSKLAQLTQPLRQLLSKKSTWFWGPHQEKSFEDTKRELANPTVLMTLKYQQKLVQMRPLMDLEHATESRAMETNSLRIPISNRDWMSLCSNWEGSVGCDMGMWEIRYLYPWYEILNWDWSQTVSATVGDKEPG